MKKSQLTQLLKLSDETTRHLQDMKDAILSNKASEHFHQLSDCLIQAISTRKIFRNLATTLDTNRNLVQLNKEKIERSRLFLEGIEFYKATIQEKIKGCQIQVNNVDEYFDEPMGEVDWEENYEVSEQKLKKSYEAIKQKANFLQQRTNKKLKLIDDLQTMRKFHRKVVPSQTRKLKDQVVEIGKILRIQEVELFQDIKDLNLLRIHDILRALKQKQRIEVCFKNEPYESIELVIRKNYLKSYNQAQKNKIFLEEKDLAITIACVSPHYGQLVMGVDPSTGFTNFSLLHRLLNEEEVKELFNQPQNQEEAALNSTYVYLEWIEKVLCSSTQDVVEFIRRIRQRMFCLEMNKFLFSTIRTMDFYEPLGGNKQNPEACLETQRLSFVEVRNIPFDEYLKKVYIPKIVYKCLTDYKRLRNGILNTSEQEDVTRIPIKKQNIQSYFRKLHIEDMLTPRLNSYYNIVFAYEEMMYDVIAIIPYAYPKKQSLIKIINVGKKEEKDVEIIEGIECTQWETGKSVYNDQIQHLEWSLNERIHEFTQIHQHEDLFFLFQLNRMFTLIAGLPIARVNHPEQKLKII